MRPIVGRTEAFVEAQTIEGLGRGAVFDERFELSAIVGSGAVGVVFRALDRRTGEPCAVKVLRSVHHEDVERFEREAYALSRLSHDAIVRHVAHGSTPTGQRYLAMQWLDGETLAERLAARPMSERETLTLARRIAEAIAASHDAGVLHRDLKPANIVLVEGDVSRATLVDFGLVRLRQDPVRTRTGVPLGTPAYMAPEQVRGEHDIDARVDVFSVGSILYECLSGRRAFVGSGIVDVFTAVLLEEVEPLRARAPALSPALCKLVERMLSKDRRARPRDGRAIIDALDELEAAARSAAASARDPSETHVFEHACAATVRGPRKLVWALFCDTDRWDRFCKAPRNDYLSHDDPAADGGVARVGTAEIAGLPSRWLEVGEGIEGVRLRAARRFLDGLFAEIGYDVDVGDDPDATGARSTVRCVARVVSDGRAPEGGAEMMLAFLAERLERYVAALSALLERAPASALEARPDESGSAHARRLLLATAWDDPALAGRATGVERAAMASRIERWAAPIDGVDGALQTSLARFAEQAADDLVRRLRPAEIADAWGVERAQMLRALLAGAKLGLFELRWELRCRNCRSSAASVAALDAVTPTVHCAECGIDTGIDLSTNVEAVFTVAPAARKVSAKMFCGASPTHRPHVAVFLSVGPGELRSFEVALPARACVVRAPRRAKSARVAYERAPATLTVHVSAAGVESSASSESTEGATTVVIHNTTDVAAEVQLEYPTDGAETAAVSVFALPEYARWFRDDAPMRGAELAMSRCAVLHIECVALDAMFSRFSDSEACARLERALRSIEQAIEAGGAGSVFRRSLGAAGALFLDAKGALAAFERARDRAEREGVTIGGAVFDGPCVMVRRDERLEIYGAGAHRAIVAARRAGPNECVTVE